MKTNYEVVVKCIVKQAIPVHDAGPILGYIDFNHDIGGQRLEHTPWDRSINRPVSFQDSVCSNDADYLNVVICTDCSIKKHSATYEERLDDIW